MDINIDGWSDSDQVIHEEIILHKIFITFGGGMAGGNKTYYAPEIRDFDWYGFIIIDHFGEEIKLNLNHVVEIKKVKCVRFLKTYRNEIRVYEVGSVDCDDYTIKRKYKQGCNDNLIFEKQNVVQELLKKHHENNHDE